MELIDAPLRARRVPHATSLLLRVLAARRTETSYSSHERNCPSLETRERSDIPCSGKLVESTTLHVPGTAPGADVLRVNRESPTLEASNSYARNEHGAHQCSIPSGWNLGGPAAMEREAADASPPTAKVLFSIWDSAYEHTLLQCRKPTSQPKGSNTSNSNREMSRS